VNIEAYRALSPTTLADCLPRDQVMNPLLRPLWQDMPRLAGPAYTVRCGPGDSLMLHAAIYRAPPGAVLVVEAADCDFALAGGNVCAVAHKHGIAGFVVDGAVRDVAEIKASGFPVFCRAVVPKPGSKEYLGSLGAVVTCGGVRVAPGDILIGDLEGIVVVPSGTQESVLQAAQKRAAADAAQSLEDWERDHRRRIDEALAAQGFNGRDS
jgi:regulator of RNase E activity RraA